MSWRKPGILIPDLYLYSIKIQTDIDQNTIIKLQKNHIFFEIIFEEFLFFIIFIIFLGRTQLGPCGWAEPSRPYQVANYISREQWNSISLFTWIIFDMNSEIEFHCSSELYFTWTVKCEKMVMHRDEKGDKPGGGNNVEDDGEHS